MDIDPQTTLARTRRRNLAKQAETRIDEESIEFHRRVRECYLALAEREPQRVRLIDGREDADTVAQRIWDQVRPLIQ